MSKKNTGWPPLVWSTSFPPPQSRLFVVTLFFIVTLLSACDVVEVEEETARNSAPDFNQFLAIMDILTTPIVTAEGAKTCVAAGCHERNEGTGGLLRVIAQPADEDELCTNYLSVIAFVNVNNPAKSKLLLEPLAGTSSLTGTHSGGDIFTTNNREYSDILAWISEPVILANPRDPCSQ